MRNLAIALPLLLSVLVSASSSAEEPAQEFLDGLRSRGYHDIAMDYLQAMETSRLAPTELKQSILYEKAMTLVAASRLQRDSAVRTQFINDAQTLLKQFVATHGSDPKVNSARSQLGNLIVERARLKIEQSKRGNTKTLIAEARGLYDEAFKVFGEMQSALSEELEQIPKVLDQRDKKQAQLAERRKQLRADNLQTELVAAAIREETADTVPNGSTEHDEYLLEAAALYDGIYKKYRGRLAGYYARMYQGRCNQRLGKLRDAIGYYRELLDQPDELEAFQDLKTKTLRLAMECWLSPSQKKYLEAIKQADAWLSAAPANKVRETDWLAIRLSLAKAYLLQADDAERKDPNNARLIAQSIAEAKKEAKFVATETSEFQEEAAELLVKLGGRDLMQQDAEPTTFAAAQTIAKEALDLIGPASGKLKQVNAQLAAASDDAQRSAIQTQLDAAEQELATAKHDAMHNYRLALRLAGGDTPQSDLNLVRYFLSYLYFLQQDYFEAAVAGEFVARRYPNSAGAKQSANIALASYLKLFNELETRDTPFEIERLYSTADYMSTTWPESNEALGALTTLVPIMVNAGELDRARELTLKIPESLPDRGQAEFVTGQAMWGRQLEDARLIRQWQQDGTPEDADPDAKRAEIEKFKLAAHELLVAGYGRLPDDPEVTRSSATAMLSLAQSHFDSGEVTETITVLEHEKLGPLTLVDAQHSEVDDPKLVEEVYRTALQAYVASLGTGGAEAMEEAKRMMTALQQKIGSDPGGQQRLLAIYVSLAQSIEKQMQSAEPEAKQEMSQVFEAFLQELGSGSTDLSVLNWVAETFAAIGAGFDEGETLNEDARKYYERSVAAFENMLQTVQADPKVAAQIKLRTAGVKVKMRAFQQALDIYDEVLQANPSALNVQVEAARLLQQWGQQDPSRYYEAISGVNKPGQQPTIWGWGKISQVTQRYKQFRDTFYEARYEVARCRFDLAQTVSGAEKEKLLSSARRNLSATMQLYPTLGGPKWTKEYNDLLNKIPGK